MQGEDGGQVVLHPHHLRPHPGEGQGQGPIARPQVQDLPAADPLGPQAFLQGLEEEQGGRVHLPRREDPGEVVEGVLRPQDAGGKGPPEGGEGRGLLLLLQEGHPVGPLPPHHHAVAQKGPGLLEVALKPLVLVPGEVEPSSHPEGPGRGHEARLDIGRPSPGGEGQDHEVVCSRRRLPGKGEPGLEAARREAAEGGPGGLQPLHRHPPLQGEASPAHPGVQVQGPLAEGLHRLLQEVVDRVPVPPGPGLDEEPAPGVGKGGEAVVGFPRQAHVLPG